MSKSDVIVTILDANDNSPMFSQPSYAFVIPEDLAVGSNIANISAKDIDKDSFGQITYSLRGFGMNKFGTDPEKGNLFLKSSQYKYICIFFNINLNYKHIYIYPIVYSRLK